MPQCLIGLGSNLGNSAALLIAAWQSIAQVRETGTLRLSRIFRTQPIGGPVGQPPFCNAVGLIETALDPKSLLRELQAVEDSLGRVRQERWGPRAIDLDLLTYGQLELRESSLTLPHPRMAFRRFVLEPAAEIAPDFVCPPNGWTIGQLLSHLNRAPRRIALAALDDAVLSQSLQQIAARAGVKVFEASAFENSQPTDISNGAWSLVRGWPLDRCETADFRLIVLIDAPGELSPAADERRDRWRRLTHRSDVGPVLWLETSDPALVSDEVVAAMAAMQ